jgi:hypothetical protein
MTELSRPRDLRTLSVRINEDDASALLQLRDALGQAETGSPLRRELDAVRGRNALYGDVSEGQIVRWALRYALAHFPEDDAARPRPSYGGDRDRHTVAGPVDRPTVAGPGGTDG